MGKLLETHWNITEIELGVEDVVYDAISGMRYFEHKIIRTGMGGIIDFQIIYDRKSEQELADQAEQEEDARIYEAELAKKLEE